MTADELREYIGCFVHCRFCYSALGKIVLYLDQVVLRHHAEARLDGDVWRERPKRSGRWTRPKSAWSAKDRPLPARANMTTTIPFSDRVACPKCGKITTLSNLRQREIASP
jgi:hypothetical protein